MPLTDTAIRSAKCGDKDIKLTDEKGLYLLLSKAGGKLWRFRYHFDGKEKKLSFGSYPEVPLKEARRRRDEARSQVAHDVDPGALKKAEQAAKGERLRNTFDSVAEEYLTHMEKDGRQANTVARLVGCTA